MGLNWDFWSLNCFNLDGDYSHVGDEIPLRVAILVVAVEAKPARVVDGFGEHPGDVVSNSLAAC